MSALNSVLAGLELRKTPCNDALILSQDGFVSEGLSSNVFWEKDNQLFTSALSTGCVNGASRRKILKAFEVEEVPRTLEEMLKADHIIFTSALGVKSVQQIENKSFADSPRLTELQELYR